MNIEKTLKEFDERIVKILKLYENVGVIRKQDMLSIKSFLKKALQQTRKEIIKEGEEHLRNEIELNKKQIRKETIEEATKNLPIIKGPKSMIEEIYNDIIFQIKDNLKKMLEE